MKTYFIISHKDLVEFINAVNHSLDRGYELHGDTITTSHVLPDGKTVTYYKQAIIGDKGIVFAMETMLGDYDSKIEKPSG